MLHSAHCLSLVAYIDPGTGAIILQMIMAGIVGAGVYFRKALKKLFGFLGRGDKDQSPDEDQRGEG